MKTNPFCHEAFRGKPVQAAERREQAMFRALRALAKQHGVKLREPLHIDGNGEIAVVVDGGDSFGSLGDVLAKYPTRTGLWAHKGVAQPYCCWVYVNHFILAEILFDQLGKKRKHSTGDKQP